MFIEASLICGAEKFRDESDEEKCVETSDLINENPESHTITDCYQVPR
jgi:hypothetical protein